MKFKPERANGILLFIGDNTSRDYAALEIRNQYLVYSFNLGNYSYKFEFVFDLSLAIETLAVTDLLQQSYRQRIYLLN